MSKKLLLSLIVVGLIASALFYTNEKKTSQIEIWKDAPQTVISGERKQHLSRPANTIINDKLATVFSNKSQILFQYDDNEHVEVAKGISTNIWLESAGNNVYVFWWTKTVVGKQLFISMSNDLGKTFAEKKLINTGGQILPALDIAVHENGNIAVMYTDERKPKFQVYVNTSSDGGITWNEQDYRLDTDDNAQVNRKNAPISFAVNPHITYLKNGDLFALWQQKKSYDNKIQAQFVARVSKDNGKNWGEEFLIYSAKDTSFTVENELISSDEDIVLLAAYPKKGLLAFHAKVNDLQKWSVIQGLKPTENANTVSWLRAAISGKKLKASYTIQKEEGEKFRVEVAELSLDTDSWKTDIHRLDIKDDTVVKTKAWYQDVSALSNGEFVAIWEDFRGVSPSVFITYTENQGEKWREAIPLTRIGYSEVKNPRLLVSDNKIMVLFESYVLRDLTSFPQLTVRIIDYFPDNKEIAIAKPPSSDKYKDKKKERLVERVNALMDLRVKKEWEKTWDFLDPIFKRKFDKQAWLGNQGKITFESYKFKSATVSSKYFGIAQIETTYSLPQQILGGEISEATGSKTAPAELSWIWFYDDWYFAPKSTFTRHLKY